VGFEQGVQMIWMIEPKTNVACEYCRHDVHVIIILCDVLQLQSAQIIYESVLSMQLISGRLTGEINAFV